MKTPQKYIENLKNKIITSEMLEDALYSVNKRAKNYRDLARKSRNYYFFGGDKNEEKKQEMYSYKEQLLKCLNPICIHKELNRYETTRHFSYQKDYSKQYFQGFMHGTITWENFYFNKDEYIYFFDLADPNKPVYHYYLYYVLGEHSFHSIIENPDDYDLKVVDIGTLRTQGVEVNDLLSLQFVRQMLPVIESGDYTFVQDTENVVQNFPYEKKEFRAPSWEEVWNFLKDDIGKYIASCKKQIDLKLSIHLMEDLYRGKKKKKKIGRPYFSRAELKLTCPELTPEQEKFIKKNFSDEMNARQFVELLYQTLPEYFDEKIEKYSIETEASNFLNKMASQLVREKEDSITFIDLKDELIKQNILCD